jgi:DNA-directed RNA polymerase I subunit RPA1
LELDDRLSAVTKQSKPEGDEEKSKTSNMQSAILAVDKVLKELEGSMGKNDKIYKLSAYEDACHRELVKEVISSCKSSKSCPHCGAFSPRIRQDASNKIFQAALSASSARINEAEGIELLPALVRTGRNKSSGSSADDMDADSTNDGNGANDKEDHAGDTPASRDKYMHPAEVKAQIETTWKTNPDLL